MQFNMPDRVYTDADGTKIQFHGHWQELGAQTRYPPKYSGGCPTIEFTTGARVRKIRKRFSWFDSIWSSVRQCCCNQHSFANFQSHLSQTLLHLPMIPTRSYKVHQALDEIASLLSPPPCSALSHLNMQVPSCMTATKTLRYLLNVICHDKDKTWATVTPLHRHAEEYKTTMYPWHMCRCVSLSVGFSYSCNFDFLMICQLGRTPKIMCSLHMFLIKDIVVVTGFLPAGIFRECLGNYQNHNEGDLWL